MCTSHHCHIYAPIAAFVAFTPYKFDGAPRTLTWQSLDLVQWCVVDCSRWLQMTEGKRAVALWFKSIHGTMGCQIDPSWWTH